MNRIEKVRAVIDDILQNMTDPVERRCAYVHLYGVAQACALIAIRRKENVELSVIAGMLHDIHTYAHVDSRNHAHKGAAMAREILTSLHLFSDSETDMICSAIHNHSDKSTVSASFDEVLKDADVMQHGLYNPLFEINHNEQHRFNALSVEFGLES